MWLLLCNPADCNISKWFCAAQFSEKSFQLRTKDGHEAHCTSIEGDTSGESFKEYGINRNSVLNKLKHFHVCDGSLLPDIMHDVLEGVLQYEVKLMLKHMICVEQYFSLDFLNTRLKNIELSCTESKNRPTCISPSTMSSGGNTLKQSGK